MRGNNSRLGKVDGRRGKILTGQVEMVIGQAGEILVGQGIFF